MNRPKVNGRFWLGAVLSLLLGLAFEHALGGIATDPQHDGLSPNQQLERATWEAEQAMVERAKVARERNERSVAHKKELVAAMESQRLLRQELISPGAPAPKRVDPVVQDSDWGRIIGLLCLVIASMAAWQWNRKTRDYNELLRLTGTYSGAEIRNQFSVFADEFKKGPEPQPAVQQCLDCSASTLVYAAPQNAPANTVEAEVQTDGISMELAHLRRLVSQCNPELPNGPQLELIKKLLHHLSLLKNQAAAPELMNVWQLTCALENLLQYVVRTGPALTMSAARTVSGAVDLLHALSVEPTGQLLNHPPVRLLAVDDDANSRHAVSLSLNKVLTAADLASNGSEALALAKQHAYDAIFLDIEMPDINGFEVCSLIHATPLNRSTPVVFVTSHSGIAERARSALIGGQELIGKPFIVFELAVKALTLVLKRRLQAIAYCPNPAPRLEAAEDAARLQTESEPRAVVAGAY